MSTPLKTFASLLSIFLLVVSVEVAPAAVEPAVDEFDRICSIAYGTETVATTGWIQLYGSWQIGWGPEVGDGSFGDCMKWCFEGDGDCTHETAT